MSVNNIISLTIIAILTVLTVIDMIDIILKTLGRKCIPAQRLYKISMILSVILLIVSTLNFLWIINH